MINTIWSFGLYLLNLDQNTFCRIILIHKPYLNIDPYSTIIFWANEYWLHTASLNFDQMETLSMLAKNFSRWHSEIFFSHFSLSFLHANCLLMCKFARNFSLFLGKLRKYIVNLLSAELAQGVVKVKNASTIIQCKLTCLSSLILYPKLTRQALNSFGSSRRVLFLSKWLKDKRNSFIWSSLMPFESRVNIWNKGWLIH